MGNAIPLCIATLYTHMPHPALPTHISNDVFSHQVSHPIFPYCTSHFPHILLDAFSLSQRGKFLSLTPPGRLLLLRRRVLARHVRRRLPPLAHLLLRPRLLSPITLEALAKVLMRSPFYIFISSKAPRVWWRHGLTKVQPVAKVRFTTTGRERMTLFVFVNSHFIPGLG